MIMNPDKEKKNIARNIGISAVVGAGGGLAAREVSKKALGLQNKIDPLHFYDENNQLGKLVADPNNAGLTNTEILEKAKMTPDELAKLNKLSWEGAAASGLGSLAALTLLSGVDKYRKYRDKLGAERYNVRTAKNLALKEAGFPSEDEGYYEKAVVPVTKR